MHMSVMFLIRSHYYCLYLYSYLVTMQQTSSSFDFTDLSTDFDSAGVERADDAGDVFFKVLVSTSFIVSGSIILRALDRLAVV